MGSSDWTRRLGMGVASVGCVRIGVSVELVASTGDA